MNKFVPLYVSVQRKIDAENRKYSVQNLSLYFFGNTLACKEIM